jgi:hypothetical protein
MGRPPNTPEQAEAARLRANERSRANNAVRSAARKVIAAAKAEATRARRQEYHLEYKRKRRVEQGIRPHSEGNNANKPWEAEGIAKSTWYDRRTAAKKALQELFPAPAGFEHGLEMPETAEDFKRIAHLERLRNGIPEPTLPIISENGRFQRAPRPNEGIQP